VRILERIIDCITWVIHQIFPSSRKRTIKYSNTQAKIQGWIAVRYDDSVLSCETSRFYLLGRPDTFVDWEKEGWTWQEVVMSVKKKSKARSLPREKA